MSISKAIGTFPGFTRPERILKQQFFVDSFYFFWKITDVYEMNHPLIALISARQSELSTAIFLIKYNLVP